MATAAILDFCTESNNSRAQHATENVCFLLLDAAAERRDLTTFIVGDASFQRDCGNEIGTTRRSVVVL